MLRWLLPLLALLWAPAWAWAQTPPNSIGVACGFSTNPITVSSGNWVILQCDSAGRLITTGGSGSISPAPYQGTPLTGAQYNQAATSATPLTIPTGATYARICAVTAQMNFTDAVGDTPVTGAAPTVGVPLAAGACITEYGPAILAVFKIINAVNATGVWNASYFK